MKFATSALLSLAGAAIAATPYTAATAAPTKSPCPTAGGGYMPGGPTAGSVPTPPPAPTKTPCATPEAVYTPGTPTSGTMPPSGVYPATPTPAPEAYAAPPVSTDSPAYTPATPTPAPEAYTVPPMTPITSPETPEKPCDKDAPMPPPYTAPSVPAAESYTVRTSARQAVMYTDEAGVQYFQDTSGQWYYYPSPTPVPTMAPTPEPAGPGSSIEFGDLAAESSGDNSVSVGASEDMAAGAANGQNGAMAAAAVSPGAPGAIGLAF